MKKNILLTIGTLTVAATLGLGIYHSDASQSEPTLTKSEITSLIETQYPGEITEVNLEKDFKKAIYEVTLKGDGKWYKLIMDGDSGEVLKLEEKPVVNNSNERKTNEKKTNEEKAKRKTKADKQKDDVDKNQKESHKSKAKEKENDLGVTDKKEQQKKEQKTSEKEQDNNSSNKETQNKKGNTNQEAKTNQSKNKKSESKPLIDMNEASQIALKEFSGTVTEVELDEDDGRLIYEIEVEAGDQEAEMEIDAHTGEVLVIEIDD